MNNIQYKLFGIALVTLLLSVLTPSSIYAFGDPNCPNGLGPLPPAPQIVMNDIVVNGVRVGCSFSWDGVDVLPSGTALQSPLFTSRGTFPATGTPSTISFVLPDFAASLGGIAAAPNTIITGMTASWGSWDPGSTCRQGLSSPTLTCTMPGNNGNPPPGLTSSPTSPVTLPPSTITPSPSSTITPPATITPPVTPPSKQYNATWVVTSSGNSINNFHTLNPDMALNNEWKVASYPQRTANALLYDSDYFSSHFPFISGSTEKKMGKKYIKFNTSLTLTSSDVFNNSDADTAVVYVQGDININTDFTPPGTVILIAQGNIIIVPQVKQVNAILIADKQIQTGNGIDQLQATGSWIAYGKDTVSGFAFQRRAPSLTDPSEKIKLDARMYTALRDVIGTSTYMWEEISP